jgi:hypothetical protein
MCKSLLPVLSDLQPVWIIWWFDNQMKCLIFGEATVLSSTVAVPLVFPDHRDQCQAFPGKGCSLFNTFFSLSLFFFLSFSFSFFSLSLFSFFFLLFFFFFLVGLRFELRASRLHSHSTAWATPPVYLSWLFWSGFLWTVCPGWPQTAILPISASQVARITGMSHHCLANTHSFIKAVTDFISSHREEAANSLRVLLRSVL